MTKHEIYKIAIANGFKIKQQPDGTMDLNPYVYEFAQAILDRTDALQLFQGLVYRALDELQREKEDRSKERARLIGDIELAIEGKHPALRQEGIGKPRRS